VVEDAARGEAQIAAALDDGRARAGFAALVEAQGGDPAVVTGARSLPHAPDVEEVRAEASGRLAWADVSELGRAVLALGGGRRGAEDSVDHAVGLVARVAAGDQFRAGDVLFEIHHRGGRGLDEALRHLGDALQPPDRADASELAPLVRARIEG
jgi:thymidine phosphorylase